MNEETAELYGRVFGMETIGLRYFNVFGSRQDPAGAYAAVVPKFAMSLIRHETPRIHGDGSNSRDFTYIDNVVQANFLALEVAAPEAVNQIYNVAFGERTNLNELFDAMRSALAIFDPAIAEIGVCHGVPRPGDIPHSLADIGKAQNLLKYAPQIDLRHGLKQTAQWYYGNLK